MSAADIVRKRAKSYWSDATTLEAIGNARGTATIGDKEFVDVDLWQAARYYKAFARDLSKLADEVGKAASDG